MTIKVLEAAKLDLVKGFDFYEFQEEGVGQYFLDTLYSDIDSLKISAGVHPRNDKEYYYMLSRIFPFAIYYKIESNIVFIYAILDCRSNPQKIDNKLK